MAWVAKDKKARRTYKPGNLLGFKWQRFIRGPDKELLEKLYEPGLKQAVRYDRCCSYFSSSVLAAAARGYAGLTRRLLLLDKDAPRPAVRLLVNEELAEADVQALIERGDAEALAKRLQSRFKTPQDALERERLGMLAWLLQAGFLEVRVGVMRQGAGIAHAKYGMMFDERGAAVVFGGSGNETASGLLANYEQVEVSTSRADPDRYRHYCDEFKRLWSNNDPYVCTVSLPEALREKLIKLAPAEPPVREPEADRKRLEAAMVWRFISEATYLPNGAAACDATMMVDLWPHQNHVVEDTARAWPAGRLLCDEVGMGKTIEAIAVIRRLRAGRGVKRALILVPAGLLKQWQTELREKGGLVVPRFENDHLVWPDDANRAVPLQEALKEDILLMSRETARMESQLNRILAGPDWDLVLMDEAHAARRAGVVEGEFNSGNLLLCMLRELAFTGKARSILLLSATPMQIHPWEPWDLMSVLGVGGLWLSEFAWVRSYYGCIAALGRPDVPVPEDLAHDAATLLRVEADSDGELQNRIAFAVGHDRRELARFLRRQSPLSQRMHRNTRKTLDAYFDMGLLDHRHSQRQVDDARFNYEDEERGVYDAVTDYIERRFGLLAGGGGKGFVKTVYRRRASSSPRALHESLRRRRELLTRVIGRQALDQFLPSEEDPDLTSFLDSDEEVPDGRIPAGVPQNPRDAQSEAEEIDRLQDRLTALGSHDSKRDFFWPILRDLIEEGRRVLVFSCYRDTVHYVRDFIKDFYAGVGSFTGEGGARLDDGQWVGCSKEAITDALRNGELQVLVCNDAASEGLNLQAASAVVNYDLPWNPSRVEQRIGRVDRIGQTSDRVRVVNLFLTDSVDDRVYGALRKRCGLFEHFVGPMQPVLAVARDVLLGRGSPEELESKAREVERDDLVQETYISAEAERVETESPLSREDTLTALGLLTPDMPVQATRKGTGATLKSARGASICGRRSIHLGFTPKALESDAAACAVLPESEIASEIARRLAHKGELLPLVIGSYADGPFRVSAVKWLTVGAVENVRSLAELMTRIVGWDGKRPEPSRFQEALRAAEGEARAEVEQMVARADTSASGAASSQKRAARLRLLAELARFLACLDARGDMNKVLYEHTNRSDARAEWLRKAFGLLGGAYPDWSGELHVDLRAFIEDLPENRRTARLLGSELHAAMSDPRWQTQTGVGQAP
jgi:superfamily II DNA/RNA helicase